MALSLNVNVPVAEQTASGEKVTPTVNLGACRAGTNAPQVLLATANGPLTAHRDTITVKRRFRRC